jgi:hypothetical protein
MGQEYNEKVFSVHMLSILHVGGLVAGSLCQLYIILLLTLPNRCACSRLTIIVMKLLKFTRKTD